MIIFDYIFIGYFYFYIYIIYIYFSCLNDDELAFLGASWPKYSELAQKHNLQIIRYLLLHLKIIIV